MKPERAQESDPSYEALAGLVRVAARKLADQQGGTGPVLEFTLKARGAPFSISYRFDEIDPSDREVADECVMALSWLLLAEMRRRRFDAK